MLLFRISTILALAVNLILGILVLYTQPKRRANRFFFLTTLACTLWLACFLGGGFTQDPAQLIYWVRGAGATAPILPVSIDALSWAVAHPNARWRSLRKRIRIWFWLAIPTIAIACSAWHVTGISFGPTGFAEARYGPLQAPYIAYWILALGVLALRFVRDHARADGIEKAELQFLLLGASASLVSGVAMAQIGPLFTGKQTFVPLTPLCIIVFDAIIAYGIATGRILSVGVLLRRLSAYTLLTIYLALVYTLIVLSAGVLIPNPDRAMAQSMAHILAAVAVVLSLSPARGWFQRFANRLFINMAPLDIAHVLDNAHAQLMTIRTTDALLSRFAQMAGETMGSDRVWIYLRDARGFLCFLPHNTDAAPQRLDTPHPLSIALENRTTTFSADELRRQRPTENTERLLEALDQLQLQIVIPIRAERRLLGALMLGRRLSGRFYSAEEQAFLNLLCAQLGVAIENARLYTKVENDRIYNEILLNALNNGVAAVRVDGTITVFNREAQRITGRSPDEIIGQNISVLPEPLAEILKTTLTTGNGVLDHTGFIARNDSDGSPVRISSTVFQSHLGERMGALALIHDITTLRKLEAQIRRTDRLSSLGTLSAGMAHEIKNPLVSIKAFAQLLPERFDDAVFRETFSKLVVREVMRIDGIVNRLLGFAAPTPAHLTSIGLHQVLDDTLQLVTQQMNAANIRLIQEFRAQRDGILGDVDLLNQALVNFLLNAQQSMPNGGIIVIATTNPPTKPKSGESVIRLTIHDSGCGIPEHLLPHVFDPFFSTKPDGTGMGLSVAHGIIQEHAGRIEIESDEGKGTTVLIEFPLMAPSSIP